MLISKHVAEPTFHFRGFPSRNYINLSLTHKETREIFTSFVLIFLTRIHEHVGIQQTTKYAFRFYVPRYFSTLRLLAENGDCSKLVGQSPLPQIHLVVDR